jgi:diguanylate cyclase
VNTPAQREHDAVEMAWARRELFELRVEANKARRALESLQEYMAEARTRVAGSSNACDLLEANELLVLALMQSKVDADEAMHALLEMSRVAALDALTKLPNRLLFLDRFTQAIAGGRRRHRRMAVLFVDLNHFKQINDERGHHFGDEVLQLAARCMVSAVRASDTVSRHGGDEFLILLDDVAHASDASAIADKINAALAVPSTLGEHVLSLSASIGISVYPDDGEEAQTLIDRADAAMYDAKRHGLGSAMFSASGHPSGDALQAALPESLRRPVTHFQQAIGEQEDRNQLLQETNGQLLLTALDARRLQDAAEQALRRHNLQIARAVHELRSPLMSIRTASAVMASMGSPQPLPRMNAVIERQVAQMSRLVGDLLDVSRVQGGKLRLERSAVNLIALINGVVDASRPSLDARLQRLQVQLPTGETMLYGDPVRLTQVLRNLLDNASKFTPPSGEITLSMRRYADAVVLTVRDNGIGIGAQALPHIFEPFMQDEIATAFNDDGLGLGLAVVEELVAAHGGTVTASSPGAGMGSEFTVTLPLTPVPVEAGPNRPA